MDNSDELAGLVYLTPNANPDSGTSLETVRFQNLYNRLITYDANELHKANSFECDQSRLTLVFFIRDIKNDNIKRSPLNRVQDKFNFDSQFEKQINNYKGE